MSKPLLALMKLDLLLWPWKAILVLIFFAGCSATKFLKEGQTFYTGAEIKFETDRRVWGKKNLENELELYLRPKPNTTILGSRPGVWLYFIAGTPEKKTGFRNFIKNKLGHPPVLLEDVIYSRTAKMLEGAVNNKGYFKSEVKSSVWSKNKKSGVIYTVTLFPPYRYRNITYPKGRDSTYVSVLKDLYENSTLEEGDRYDLEKLKNEQERIEKEVENFGFYYFDDRYLIFEADSTEGKKQVDLRLRLEPGIPDRAKIIYRFKNVNVWSEYTLSHGTFSVLRDTIRIDEFNYFGDRNNFRPEIITRVINIKPGNVYTRTDHDLTISHLMDMGTFKFVNVKFQPVDSALLNADIYLTPLKKKSIRMEVQAVSKSNNFVGPGISATFTNRNFLGGAELFQLKLNTAYEVQVSSRLPDPLNAFEIGIETSLAIPRFITPVRINYNSKRYLPKTMFALGFNLQNRVGYFRINSFNARYGYNWRETPAKSHELFPVDLNFIKTDKISPEFAVTLERNPLLANSFSNQFIIGTRYSYILNTQFRNEQTEQFTNQEFKSSGIYFNGNIDIAGNLIHAIQKLNKSAEAPYKLFGSPYSQYVLGDLDFRYYWQIDQQNMLATRFVVGAGYPYGNSTTLPYIKQFSVGGSNSIRAFPARTVGPGTFNFRTDSTLGQFVDQRGDIKLEGNIEYRFEIVGILDGAVFADAGNIWLWRKDESRPGGEFDHDTFLQQLAVGTGVGVRFDFNFFVLRLDIAFPLRKPYLPKHDRWVFDQIDFGSPTWRSENLIFNIAIGYPF